MKNIIQTDRKPHFSLAKRFTKIKERYNRDTKMTSRHCLGRFKDLTDKLNYFKL